MRRLKKELWPIRIRISRYNDDIESWLESSLGLFRNQWNAVYYEEYTDYYFRSEQDALIFSLKYT